MKISRIMAVGALALSLTTVAACGRVPAGYEGVIIDNAGGGVQERERGEGWSFHGPTRTLVTFSLREQTYVWTQDRREGSENDESFRIQDSNGMEIGFDLGIRFMVTPGTSSEFVQRFGPNQEAIIDGRVRNTVRTAMNNIIGRYTAAEIYGGGREQVLNELHEVVVPQLEQLGFQDIELYWVSAPRLPDAVRRAIEATIEAENLALRRQEEIATAQYNAEIRIAEARGEAESRLLRANAEAEAINVIGEAIAANPSYLRQQEIEAWSAGGSQMPQVVVAGDSGVVPLLNVGTQRE